VPRVQRVQLLRFAGPTKTETKKKKTSRRVADVMKENQVWQRNGDGGEKEREERGDEVRQRKE
jgi:hypothetical protein